MRPMIGGLTFGCLLLGTWCTPAVADGGSMRLSGKKGGYQIAVFTAPTPFRAGTVDISALVQDASTGDPLSEVRVTIRMTRPGVLPWNIRPQPRRRPTSSSAAQFELPEAGRWDMQVQVEGLHGIAVIGGEVEAAESLPRWPELWPWIGWPAPVIVFFSIHQILVQRRFGRAGPMAR